MISDYAIAIPTLGLVVTVTVYISFIGGICKFRELRSLLKDPQDSPRRWLLAGFCSVLFVPPAICAFWGHLLLRLIYGSG